MDTDDRNLIERLTWDEVARRIEGSRCRQAATELAKQSHGSHADKLEISLMLALAPELVDMTRAEAGPALTQDVPGRLTPTDTASPNYSRSGSFGDPTLATRAKGEILLKAMLDDLSEQVCGFVAELSATAPLRSVSQ